jgi:SAM-dependent methyltransferase
MRGVPPYFDFLIEAFRRGETGRFVHLGHWDAEPTARPDDFARAQARLDAILLDMAGLADGQQILDVGCGFGGTLQSIDRRHAHMHLTGVNLDPRQLELCRQIASIHRNRLVWEEADACRLPFADCTFDRVLCIEAMFHFASRRDFFAEAARVLRPGGILVASDIVLVDSAAPLDPEASLREGYGPWPDPWSREGDYDALAADLRSTLRIDATRNTFPSHRYTCPPSLDENRDPGSPALRAALMLRKLHREGHLKYWYLRFDKP